MCAYLCMHAEVGDSFRFCLKTSPSFETGSLTGSGAHGVGETGWPVSPQDLPVFASLAPGSQVLAVTPSAGTRTQLVPHVFRTSTSQMSHLHILPIFSLLK